MLENKKIGVVIPAFNEEAYVSKVIKELPDFIDAIILVDDGSKDETRKKAEETNDPRLTVLAHQRNLGIGAAMASGYRKALQLELDIIARVDADGQMPCHLIKDLILSILNSGVDYVKGNRFILREGLAEMPAQRRFGNFWLTLMTKLMSGYWHIFDPQNGFTAILNEKLQQIDLDSLYPGEFFENDMLVKLNILEARVRDFPMRAQYGGEQSSIKIWKVLLAFPSFFLSRFRLRLYQKHILRDFSAIGLFYVAGIPLFLAGFLFGLIAWSISVATNIPATTGTVMLAVLPMILGFQLILQAIVLEIQENQRLHESTKLMND